MHRPIGQIQNDHGLYILLSTKRIRSQSINNTPLPTMERKCDDLQCQTKDSCNGKREKASPTSSKKIKSQQLGGRRLKIENNPIYYYKKVINKLYSEIKMSRVIKRPRLSSEDQNTSEQANQVQENMENNRTIGENQSGENHQNEHGK